jgi:nicotinamidase-related amidase
MSGPQSLDELLRFYDERGYDRTVGVGKHLAVVVIDFSRAFTGGRSEFPGGDFGLELQHTRRLLDHARARATPVFFTTIAYQDPLRDSGLWGVKVPWLENCKLGTPLVEIDPLLNPQPGEPVIVKRFPSAFFDTDLVARLSALHVDTILLAGCTTSVCVRATAIDAMQHGYRVNVVAEAVGDFNRALHRAHLRDLQARYADVVSVDQAVALLSDAAGSPGPSRT